MLSQIYNEVQSKRVLSQIQRALEAKLSWDLPSCHSILGSLESMTRTEQLAM